MRADHPGRKLPCRGCVPVAQKGERRCRPHLPGTRAPAANRPDGPCEHVRGRWEAGARSLLMTDALAQWFLRRTEEGRPLTEVARWLEASAPKTGFPAGARNVATGTGFAPT